MRLLVIRHAKAEERDPKRWPDDSLRPLAPGGVGDFRKSAAGLRKLVTPDTLLASPYLRARQTADILHEVAGWAEPEETAELAEDSATVARLAEKLSRESPDATLAIVGHEPTLSELISNVAAGHTGARVQMKPGAAALLDITGGPGDRLTGNLLWLAQPKLMRLMA